MYLLFFNSGHSPTSKSEIWYNFNLFIYNFIISSRFNDSYHPKTQYDKLKAKIYAKISKA